MLSRQNRVLRSLLIIPSIWSAALISLTFFSNSDTSGLNNRNVMLIIAHPDDESMFFSPAINLLVSSGCNLHILCLSSGNSEGMGHIRVHELYKACRIFNIPDQQVKTINNSRLQDGFDQHWDHELLVEIIGHEIMRNGVDMVITFDQHGVSGHPNHRDVHEGTKLLIHNLGDLKVDFFELVSTNIGRKYSGLLDIWVSVLFSNYFSEFDDYFLLNSYPLKSFYAMAEHSSQWVWFRKLFVLLSRYTYINTLRKMKH